MGHPTACLVYDLWFGFLLSCAQVFAMADETLGNRQPFSCYRFVEAAGEIAKLRP